MLINNMFSAKSVIAKLMSVLAIFSLLAPSMVMAQEVPPTEETQEPPVEIVAPPEETDPIDTATTTEEVAVDEDTSSSTPPTTSTSTEPVATTTEEVATSTEVTVAITPPEITLVALPVVSPTPIDLLSAGNFAILAETEITDADPAISAITGNVGISAAAGSNITGLSCSAITGSIYDVDGTYTGGFDTNTSCLLPGPGANKTLVDNAVADMMTAYTAASDPATPAGVGPNLNIGGGTVPTQTLAPGVYTWGSNVTITGDITLAGSASDVWIFQITGTLDLEDDNEILLTGGAQASNIFWRVSGATTLKSGSTMEGTILDQTNIAMQAGARLNGRALAQTAVTFIGNTVVNDQIDPPPPPVVFAPYCGDGEISDWEQCDGGAFCTEQCLFPVQSQCPISPNFALARVNITDFSNEGDGDVSEDSYVRPLDGLVTTRLRNNTWFPILDEDPTDDFFVNYHDVPGVAIRRAGNNELKLRLFGNHPLNDGSKEHVEGYIEFFGATTTGQINDTQVGQGADNPTNGTHDETGGNDEFWRDTATGNSTFDLTVNTQNDGFFTTYEFNDDQCVIDPINDEDGGFIQGRKYRDVNKNHSFDEEEKSVTGNVNRLNDWTISLYNTDWVLIDQMQTGSDDSNLNPNHTSGNVDKGQYRFADLDAGTYNVCEEIEADWDQITPADGIIEGSIPGGANISTIEDQNNEGNYCYQVILAEGQQQTHLKFGNLETEDLDEEPTFLKVKIYKYLDGIQANSETADGYQFPMHASWSDTVDSGSGYYVLGNTHGGADQAYAAFTREMSIPTASYTTHEVVSTDDDAVEGNIILPIGATCEANKYRLAGYTTGDNLEAAQIAELTSTIPSFSNISTDKYVIVWNDDCDTVLTPNLPPVLEILGSNPFDLIIGDTFVDPFASSTDPESGDLTNQIATSTNLNINVAGNYDFVYSVNDGDNPTVYATRTVSVIEVSNTETGGGGSGGGGCIPCRPCDHIRLNCGEATSDPNPNPVLNPGPIDDLFGQGGADEGGLALLAIAGNAGNADDALTLGDATTNASTTASSTATTTDEDTNNQLAAVGALGTLFGIKWYWWILILILLGIIGYYTFRDKENN